MTVVSSPACPCCINVRIDYLWRLYKLYYIIYTHTLRLMPHPQHAHIKSPSWRRGTEWSCWSFIVLRSREESWSQGGGQKRRPCFFIHSSDPKLARSASVWSPHSAFAVMGLVLCAHWGGKRGGKWIGTWFIHSVMWLPLDCPSQPNSYVWNRKRRSFSSGPSLQVQLTKRSYSSYLFKMCPSMHFP